MEPITADRCLREIWMYEERTGLPDGERAVLKQQDGSFVADSRLLPDEATVRERSRKCSAWSLFAMQALDALDEYDPTIPVADGFDPVYVCQHAPEPLRHAGMDDLPIAMDARSVVSVFLDRGPADCLGRQHALRPEDLLRLPELLESPGLKVVRDTNGTFVVELPLPGRDGLPLVARIRPLPDRDCMVMELSPHKG